MNSKEAARVLLRTRQALLAGSVVLAGVWTWRREGIFRILSDAEERWTGRSDTFFTLMFTFLTLFVVSMAIGAVFTSFIKRRVPKDEWPSVLVDTAALWDGAWRRKE